MNRPIAGFCVIIYTKASLDFDSGFLTGGACLTHDSIRYKMKAIAHYTVTLKKGALPLTIR